MAALNLGDIETFGFLDPPERRSIRDGVMLLQELGAFDGDDKITDMGRRLAQLPVDPRMGRMILQADTEGCVREILVLAAALSIPDPRERPTDREEAARQKHARFADTATRRCSTRAQRWTCVCFRRHPSRAARWDPASGGCCDSLCHHRSKLLIDS